MSSKGDRVMKMFINFTQPVTAFFWITLDFYWDLWICGLWNQVSMAKRKIIHRSLQMLQSTLVPSSKMFHVRKDLELKICIGNSWFSSTAFEMFQVPSMGRSAYPTSPWKTSQVLFLLLHFLGALVHQFSDRATGEQLMRNLTGTLTAACINPQIMLRHGSLIVSTNSTWITKEIELHMSGGLLVSSKPFGRKCPS